MAAFGQSLNIGDTVFSPWFPRQGNNAAFRAQLISKSGSPTLTVKIFHKNVEDTGNGTQITGANIALTTVNSIGKSEPTNLKQLVRFQYVVTGTGSGSVVARMLTPVFFDDIRI